MEKKFFLYQNPEGKKKIVIFYPNYTKDSKKMFEMLKKASFYVEFFDFDERRNLFENVQIEEVGELKIKKMEKISDFFERIRKKEKIPLMISRGHLSSLYTTKKLENEKIIIFDAHADSKNKYIDELIAFDIDREKEKEKYNGAVWLRRLLEEKNLEVLLLGVRSLDEEELEFLKSKNVRIFSSREIKENLNEVIKIVKKFTENSKIYISLDIDVFDPSLVKATDYPEAGGIDYFDFSRIIESIEGELIGFDVCCFKPIENNLATEFLVDKVIAKIIGLINKV